MCFARIAIGENITKNQLSKGVQFSHRLEVARLLNSIPQKLPPYNLTAFVVEEVSTKKREGEFGNWRFGICPTVTAYPARTLMKRNN